MKGCWCLLSAWYADVLPIVSHHIKYLIYISNTGRNKYNNKYKNARHKYNYNERSGVFIGDSGLWHLPSHCMILSSQPTSFVEDCPVVSFVFVISLFCICMLTNKYKKCKPQLSLKHYYFSHF